MDRLGTSCTIVSTEIFAGPVQFRGKVCKSPQEDKGAMATSLPIISTKGQGSKRNGHRLGKGPTVNNGGMNRVDEDREVFHL